ncbi:MAG: LAGLIDADG family homing endonuclease [Candidatus Paceibacterota bacterium]
MPIFKQINKDFFKHWTPEMAYVLGFFAADGYITVNKRGGQFWSIQIIDQKLLEQIKKIIGSNHKIGVRTRKENENTVYRLQIGSIEMCNDLRKLGYGERKTKNMSIPSVPRKFFPDFLRGYFDGDGNVWVGYKHKDKKPTLTMQVSFTSCSGVFLSSLREVLANFGLGKGSLYDRDTAFRLSYSAMDGIKLYRLMYLCYSIGELYLPRKRKVFERFIKMRA